MQHFYCNEKGQLNDSLGSYGVSVLASCGHCRIYYTAVMQCQLLSMKNLSKFCLPAFLIAYCGTSAYCFLLKIPYDTDSIADMPLKIIFY